MGQGGFAVGLYFFDDLVFCYDRTFAPKKICDGPHYHICKLHKLALIRLDSMKISNCNIISVQITFQTLGFFISMGILNIDIYIVSVFWKFLFAQKLKIHFIIEVSVALVEFFVL